MSEERTTVAFQETVREAVDAWARRDFAAAVVIYSEWAVLDGSSLGVGIFEGREKIRSLLEDWVRAYEDYEIEIEEARDLGGGVTFVVLRHRARPFGSSGTVELRHSYTAIWADGLIERQTVRPDPDQARADAERLAEERG